MKCGPKQRPAAERFAKKYRIDSETGCWVWACGRTGDGYGNFSPGPGRSMGAHRWAYEARNGAVPDGLHLDHLCRNRACVNPDHMEPVTRRENILRGVGVTAENAGKVECVRGHELSGGNIRSYRGKRICRTCVRGWRARKALKCA